MVGSVVSNACNVLVILVLARLLGGAEVGQYTIAFAVRALLLLLCGLGMRTALTRFVAHYLAHGQPGTVHGSVRTGLLLPGLLAVGVAGLWMLLAEPMATHVFQDPSLTLPLQLFALSLPFFVVTDTALAATQGFQTMRAYTWVGQVLEPTLRLVLTTAAVLLGGGIVGASWALLLSSVVSSLAALAALNRLLGTLVDEHRRTPWRELASFAALSWVASMATQGLLWADVVILGAMVSAGEVGAYQVAARVVLIAMFVITPLTASMAPRIAHAWAHEDRALVTSRYSAVVLWTSRLSFPLLAGLLAVPSALLNVFGDDFGGANAVILILAVGAIAEAVGAPSSVLLNQIGRNRLNMVVNVSALTLNITLNVVLIPVYGIEGSAVAWAVTLVAGAAVRIVLVRRVATDRWPFSRPFAVAAVAAVLAWGAGAAVTVPLSDAPWVELLVAAPTVLVVYLGAQLALGGLAREERTALSRTISLRLPFLRRWVLGWRQRGAHGEGADLVIDEIVAPYRFDVWARADLFRLAREHAELRRCDPAAFLALAGESRYRDWFDHVLVPRGHVPGQPGAAQERAFRDIVTASLQLMDRHDRHGRESLGRVSVALVPAGTDVGGWTLAEDRWALLDGGHRTALALLAGQTTLKPGDYVVERGVLPPNNTRALLEAGVVEPREALAFLARGLAPAGGVAPGSWEELCERIDDPAQRAAVAAWQELRTGSATARP